jgi:uncharacterized membrane protein required for colicin V production
MTAHWFTIVILVYLAIGALSGWRRGLVMVGFSVGGYLVGLVLASRYQGALTKLLLTGLPLRKWLHAAVPVPAAAVPGARLAAWQLAHSLVGLLAFLVIVGGTEMVARLLGQAITAGVRRLVLVRSVNALGGMVGGMVESAVITGLVLGLVLSFPFIAHTPVAATVHHTPLARDLVRWVAQLVHWPSRRWLI